jgi:hypothetical protein
MKLRATPPRNSGDNGPGGDAKSTRHTRGEIGFDRWLKHKLHEVYDPVLDEQVPEDLIRLLEAFDSREKKDGPES